MKVSITSFFVGILFALGLGLSGMTQPQKVLGFLDFFGNWDPSLIFVMIGAISVHFLGYKIANKREQPLFVKNWQLPTNKRITPQLITGSVVFGAGWGLAGYCPGPALTSLATGNTEIIIFIFSMLIGMGTFKFAENRNLFMKR